MSVAAQLGRAPAPDRPHVAATGYGFRTALDAPYDIAIARATAALKEEGFGALTTIDVQANLKEINMYQPTIPVVDHSTVKVSQAITMLLLTTAFVLDSWPLAAFVAGANLLGAAIPPLSLFAQVYRRLLRPAGLVKPHVVPDYPEPHRFAQAFSGVVTALSAALIWSGYAAPGWAFSWLIVILAGLNVFAGFCAGCFTYYQLNRLGVPGFQRSPLRH